MKDSDSSTAPGDGSGAWSVVIVGIFAVAVLVAAVAINSRFSFSATAAETGRLSGSVAEIADVPGFRSDAWYLPADELLGFVEIPAGPFLMGSDPTMDRMAFENERWAEGGGMNSVDLPTYYIGRYEVTVAQYRAFVEATGHPAPPEALRGPPDHPVTWVTWPDALAYARWLQDTLADWPSTPATLRDRLEAGWRIAIPTEAEWEKAARGTDGRIYPWGNTPDRAFANFGRTGGTAPVGSRPCPDCPYGLSDLSGNVWEWTRSPHEVGPYGSSDGVSDLEADALWVMRGGSYDDNEQIVRAATRGGADPGARRAFIGFRVVLSPR